MSKLHIAKNLTLPLDEKELALEKQRKHARKWRTANKEKLRAYFRRYRAEHPELKAYHAEYYQKSDKSTRKPTTDAQKIRRRERARQNAEHLRLQHLEWRHRNPERVKENDRRRRMRNPDKKRLTDREYRKNNPGIYKASIARAKAANPKLYNKIARQSQLARRARKRAAIVEPVSFEHIVERDQSRCHLCREIILHESQMSLDHLIPVVRRGAHAEWNFALAHLRCNKSRGTRQILTEETREGATAYINALRGIVERTS